MNLVRSNGSTDGFFFERTILAWRRTLASLLVGSAGCLRITMHEEPAVAVGVLLVVCGVTGAVAVGSAALTRPGASHPACRPRSGGSVMVLAGTVFLAGVSMSLWMILHRVG